MIRLLTLAVVVCALFGAPAAFGAVDQRVAPRSGNTQSPATEPNIVVIYLDDTSPHDGRLWTNPDITPNLYELFVAHGARFENAVSETPLCCPGRAGLLTGLHTHNHGVTYNDIRLFNPGEHIGKALKGVGYQTMLIGKYFNHPNYLTNAQWAKAGEGWTYLDAIRTAPHPDFNYFYDYTLFTKQGDVSYPTTHSTQMIAERAVAHLQDASPVAPVFALLTPYATHNPNLPMAQFDGDPRCSTMSPWNPPSYNEADVSDKPSYIRNRDLLPQTEGWPMVDMCEEMLGIDWMVGQVRDELQAQGRLDNTLFVFSADNGMGWGQHRSGNEKQTPYATRVPLYMSWPSRWGSDPRTINDAVSNIDLAPTFCDIGGCDLGPYGTGQTEPDGISLLPRLDGSAMTRNTVLEANYSKRPFSAIRLSPSHPLGFWHYVEYKNGERELYDLANDPWELENRASDPALASLRSELSKRMDRLVAEGRVAPSPQRPDGTIAVSAVGTFKGLNIYSTVPKDTQTLRLQNVPRNSVQDFTARATNHGSAEATFSVLGTASGSARISVQYLVGETDVTEQVAKGTFTIAGVQPAGSFDLTVRFIVGDAPLDDKRAAVITVGLLGEPTQIDVVKAVAIRGLPPP